MKGVYMVHMEKKVKAIDIAVIVALISLVAFASLLPLSEKLFNSKLDSLIPDIESELAIAQKSFGAEHPKTQNLLKLRLLISQHFKRINYLPDKNISEDDEHYPPPPEISFNKKLERAFEAIGDNKDLQEAKTVIAKLLELYQQT
jgi:hypothetical protein